MSQRQGKRSKQTRRHVMCSKFVFNRVLNTQFLSPLTITISVFQKHGKRTLKVFSYNGKATPQPAIICSKLKIRARCEICSKFTIKTPERRHVFKFE